MAPGFDIVLIGVFVFAVLVGVLLSASASGIYNRIHESEFDRGSDGPGGPRATAPPEPDEEIRQMLEARNERRVVRGQEPLDIAEELRRLHTVTAQADPAIRDEVRQLVEARNARRVARGQEPLDVETETARRLGDLGRG